MGTDSLSLIKELATARKTSFLSGRREQAIAALEQSGLPGRHLENWKYTDGKAFVAGVAGLAPEAEVTAVQTLLDSYLPVIEDCYRLVMLNGYFLPENSAAPVAGKLEITSFSDLDDSTAASIAAFEILKDNPFANVNLALHDSGVQIEVPAGVQLDKPLVIVNCFTDSAAEQMVCPRVFLSLGKSAKLDVVEVAVASTDTTYSAFSVVELDVADNAQLSYVVVNRHSQKASIFNAVAGQQGRDSLLRTGVFNFGGKTTRNEIYSALNGENSRSEILGLNVLEETQHVDNHTVLDHAVPHCESFELVKGVYGDSSKGIFDGTIIVRPDAQKTNAIQSNQSLLLSDKATSNAKPQLKIWADDVKCTHGATVGQLDDNGMFYLRSRGIPEPEARAMLIHAFASEVVSEIAQEFLKESLEVLLTEKLERI